MENARESSKGSRGGLWVVGILFGFAFIMGCYVFYMYKVSMRHITTTVASMQARGKDLDFEQCVTEVVTWVPRCEAMSTLCESVSPNMMEACLKGRDRRAECKAIQDRPQDAHFGFKECQARQLTRRAMKKVCGNSYKALDEHCRSLERGS